MNNPLPQLICSLLLLFACIVGYTQDIHFSQFMEAPLLRNPALAGLFSGDLRFQMVYRNQWSSVTNAYQTGTLNGEYKLSLGSSDDFLSLGGEILFDKAGSAELSSTHILPVINYHKSLSAEKNQYFSIGFMGGIVQRKIDRSKITTNSQFDGTGYNPNVANGETFTKSSYSYFDGSVGLSYNSQMGDNADNNYFIGVAYHHFNKASNISFYESSNNKLNAKWVVSGGFKMNATEFSYLTIHADYVKQGPSTEAIGGLIYSVKIDDVVDPKYIIHGGVLYRWGDAVIPTAKIEMKPIAISLSYDANVSKLITASKARGGLEVGLSYQKFFDKKNTTKNSIRCPRF